MLYVVDVHNLFMQSYNATQYYENASIYWQIFKMGVQLQWYHMHLHSIELRYMIA